MTALLASGALGLLELPEQKAATPHAANFSSQADFKDQGLLFVWRSDKEAAYTYRSDIEDKRSAYTQCRLHHSYLPPSLIFKSVG